MSYCQPSDFLKRYDARSTGDLVNDTGVRQTPTQLLTDPNLQAALDDAAGTINSAILVGERYTTADLSALTGVDQSLLFRLNCDLAFGFLNLRRGNDPEKFPAFVQAQESLEMLRKGERLFNVAGDVAAGTVNEIFPSFQTYQTANMLRDATANRFFPVRRKQQVPGV